MSGLIGFLLCVTVGSALVVLIKLKADLAYVTYRRIDDRLEELNKVLDVKEDTE